MGVGVTIAGDVAGELVAPQLGVGLERLKEFVAFYVRNGPIVRALTESSHHDEALHATYQGLMQTFIDLTTQAIEARVAAGEIEPLDAPEVARALVWMLNGFLNDRLGGPEQADPERVLEAVWIVWTRTLLDRPG